MFQFTDHAVRKVPPERLYAAVDAAFRALGEGRLVNPPRRETLGGPGDPDYFHLEMAAALCDAAGQLMIRGCKVIDEQGARDESGARRLGTRTARLYLEHVLSRQRCVLDAQRITDLRTGAAAVWAVRYAAPSVERLGLIGTGRVARAVASAAAELLPSVRIAAYSRQVANREAFAAELARLGCPVDTVDSPAGLTGADALVAAVPAAEPVLTAGLVAGARVVVAVEGDPRAWQVAPEVMVAGPVVVDQVEQAQASGSWRHALHVGLAEVDGRAATVADMSLGRYAPPGRLVVLLTGLAGLDLMVGWEVWRALGGPRPPGGPRARPRQRGRGRHGPAGPR